MEVGKKYTVNHINPSVIYECMYLYNTHSDRLATGAVMRNTHSGHEFAILGISAYVEFKEPVIEYRYARACESTTYWTRYNGETDNIKATFTDGVLTKVEMI